MYRGILLVKLSFLIVQKYIQEKNGIILSTNFHHLAFQENFISVFIEIKHT